MIDDAELLRRYVETRAEPAFEALVERHLKLVYFTALRRVNGNAALAEDIAQQVFTAAAREAEGLMRHATVTGWLYTTTRNLAAKAVRAENVRKRHAQALEIHFMQTNAGEPAIDLERLRPVIDETLEALNPREREAVLLRFFEGRAFGEIGAALKISEDAARMRVERALDKLQVLLKRRGVTSTAGALALTLAQQATLASPAGLAASVAGAAVASLAAGTPAMAAAPTNLIALFSFMSTSKTTVGVAALVLIVALGGTIREVRAGREAVAAQASAMRENDMLAAKLRDLDRQMDAARAAATTPRVREPSPPLVRAAAPGPADAEAFLARHPEVKQAVIAACRADLAGAYSGLFRSLRLSLEQIERCLDLMLEGMSRGVGGPGGQMVFRIEGNRAEAEGPLRALLGDEWFRQYQDLSTLLGEQPPVAMATRLASALYGTSAPLTTEQAERLHDVFVAAQIRADRSRRLYDWGRIDVETRSFLSEAQRAQLAHFRASDQYRRHLDQHGVGRSLPMGPVVK
jgi:RNA polymerase sigma factor (sigma-70 family)